MAYIPNINLCPRAEEIEANLVLANIKNAFNSLCILGHGNGVYFDALGNPHLISDLFILYNVLVRIGEQGQKTYSNLFSDIYDRGLLADFLNFISEHDTTANITVKNIDIEFIAANQLQTLSSKQSVIHDNYFRYKMVAAQNIVLMNPRHKEEKYMPENPIQDKVIINNITHVSVNKFVATNVPNVLY